MDSRWQLAEGRRRLLTGETPCGGWKGSGDGREKRLEALQGYAQVKTVQRLADVTRNRSMMEDSSRLDGARAKRRAMLGDAYVDAQTADANPRLQEFQDWITGSAWGVWARGGALTDRDRSLLVLAMTAALGRMEEFRLHVSARSRTGVTDEELDELLFQVAAYCGAPAGIAAKRALQQVRAEDAQ
jgi:4-carboxymuconolactone decarboxylase